MTHTASPKTQLAEPIESPSNQSLDNDRSAIPTGDQSPVDVAPMAPEVLEALQGSIAKWERIVAGTGKDHGVDDCPLCQMFNTESAAYRPCRGCPVYEKSGRSLCSSTPYSDFSYAKRNANKAGMAFAAEAELDFLKSLLPGAQS